MRPRPRRRAAHGRRASATTASSSSTCTATTPELVRELARRARSRRRRPARGPRRARERPARARGRAAACSGRDRVALSWIDPPESSATPRAAVGADRGDRADARRQLGLQLGFHNHWGELRALDDGVTTLDLLSALPAERLVRARSRLGVGGGRGSRRAARALRRPLPARPRARISRSREQREYCPVGDGAVGYERVLPPRGARRRRVADRRAGRGRRAAVRGGRALARAVRGACR